MYSRDLLRALRVVFLHISHGQVFCIITQQPQKQRLPHSATWGTHLSCFVGWAEHPNPSLTLSSLSHLLPKAELYSGHILYNTQDLHRGRGDHDQEIHMKIHCWVLYDNLCKVSTFFSGVWIGIFSISSIFIYYLESCCQVVWLLLLFTSIYVYRRGKVKM